MKVLLSIKPQFVEQIIKGTKRYEFRKAIYKRTDIDTIVVYASSPVCRVVGEFKVDEILCETPEILWQHTHDSAGITREFFDRYFDKRDKAYAIRIKSFLPYENPTKLTEAFPGKVRLIAQSFDHRRAMFHVEQYRKLLYGHG